jgi:DNA repair photolyase
MGFSPGLDFETQIMAKPDAAELLEKELRNRRYAVAPIAIGTNTDPYQPTEKTQRIMRECLEVLKAFKHPVGIVTKGTLIERDLDILGDMARDRLVKVGVSVTSLDLKLSRLMEPRAPAPARRLKVIERLSAAGVPVRLMVSPVVPGLTDHEVERIIGAGAAAGAQAASWIMLRLPLEVSALFQEWLSVHFPDRRSKVMSLIRDMHGGQDYSSGWGKRTRGEGTYAQMIAHRVAIAMRRTGLPQELPPLRCDLFERPLAAGDQLSLF